MIGMDYLENTTSLYLYICKLKVHVEQDIFIVSKYLYPKYLVITKEKKSKFYTEESDRYYFN